MKYYIIRWSLSEKEMGYLPQVKENIYPCNINSPEFIDNYLFQRIDIDPCIPHPVIHPKSFFTDIIQAGSMGFSSNLLISEKLKIILENNFMDVYQVFKTSVFWNGIENDNYWLVHPFKFSNEYVDFESSKIIKRVRKPEGGTSPVEIFPKSISDFELEIDIARKSMEVIHIENLKLQRDLEADLFSLRYTEDGSQFVVSEKLKLEIENAKCSGIEFQPYDLSFNEWIDSRERKNVYGQSK